jgi:hypothetical protein
MADKMWRFRGILAVASVPLFLILAVVTLMPSAPKDSLDFSSHGHVQDRTLDVRGAGRRPNLHAMHDARAHARGGASPLVHAAGGGGIVADTSPGCHRSRPSRSRARRV